MIRCEVEYIRAYGHPNIKATHKTTLEITREDYLTPRGDCIIGVKADKAVTDLSPEFKSLIKKDDAILLVELSSGEIKDYILAHGNRNLVLNSKESIVIRKSSHIDTRTVAIGSNKAARDINRKLINYLKNHNRIINIRLVAISIK
ncbi:TPA: DUF371 domain-containing protein [Candidatus Geothermarchaeota archaeon]|nr:DUF371 domain-containing protein [Candidatus Geothermarchaeota archaeon]HIQ12797.1 DUF371 domain-containing protein [Thermoprotei archaeon]